MHHEPFRRRLPILFTGCTLLSGFVMIVCLARKHEESVLRFPTEHHRSAARKCNKECLNCMAELTNALNAFSNSPDQQLRHGEALIKAKKAFDQYFIDNDANPLIHVDYPEIQEDKRKMGKVVRDFDLAADQFVAELSRRRNDLSYRSNEKLYARMKAEFALTSQTDDAGTNCTSATCFWCRINSILIHTPFWKTAESN